VPLDLGRRLHAAGAVLSGELRRAVFETVTSEKPFPRALADASVAARSMLERALDDGEHAVVRSVVPHPEMLAALPPGMATRLLVVPLGKDRFTGRVDVAVVDPADTHLSAELSFHLGSPVRLIAAPLAEIERSLLLVSKPRITSTDEYEAAPPPSRLPPPESQAVVAPISAPREDAVPLVRRSRFNANDAPPSTRFAPRSDPPIPLSRRAGHRPTTSHAPTTSPIDARVDSAPVQMVVDFRAAARQELSESSRMVKLKLEPRRPPFASLTPVLEAIDAAEDRAALIGALLRGLSTTASASALFAPRKGNYVGVGAIGELNHESIRTAVLTPVGAIADAIAKNERLGTLDPRVDRELHAALGLERFTPVHVLIYASYVADRAALLLVAMGMGDVIEATRRARVLSTAASSALERLLRR